MLRREFLAGLPAAPWGAASRLQVEVRERGGKTPVPARVYLVDREGKPLAPVRVITYKRREEEHFVCDGRFEMELPPGEYSLRVERGLEYRAGTTELALRAGESREALIELERWISMNEMGWYSGDLHNHRKVEEMPLLLAAEDLNIAPTLTDWIWEGRPISKPPETTEAIRRLDTRRAYSVLDKEVERLKQGPGAVDLLALKRVIPFEGDWLYPPNDVFCRQAHAQGGYVDAEKILWRDIPALVALGHVDFGGVVHNHFNRHGVDTETEPWGMAPKDKPEYDTPLGLALWTLEVYYRFLNCGFRLAASAGSASGVKAAPLGYNRVYVHMQEAFSYESWFRALKQGRSFATNGPILLLTADGKMPGAIVELPAGGGRIRVKVEGRSAGTIERLEIVWKGRVVKTGGTNVAEVDLPVSESGWVAARAFEPPGKTIRFAQTSPIWVRVGRDPGIVAEDARYFTAWLQREADFYRKETGFRLPEHQRAMVELFEKGEAVYARLAREAE
jgi:hypothetical protein